MELGWYEGESPEGKTEYVNLDACWRLTVDRASDFSQEYAVWAWSTDNKTMLAGTKGTLEEATTYLKDIFDENSVADLDE